MTEGAAPAYEGMIARLRAAGRAVRDASEHWERERDLRDELIIEAADTGVPERAIAAAVGLSQPRIVAIKLDRRGVTS